MSFAHPHRPRLAASFRFLFVVACIIGSATLAVAGGGPENVLLVVNPNSPASLTVANHYAALRHIPDDNFFFLPWDVKHQTTDVDTFRQKILLPIIQAIQGRKLAGRIDYIIYSSDFPWAVSLKSDIKKFTEQFQRAAAGREETDKKSDDDKAKTKPSWPKQLTPVGSLNGMTFLWQAVLAGVPAYFEPNANRYMRRPGIGENVPPSIGFRSVRRFDRQGGINRYSGHRYLLSTMLGVTSGRGNTVDEVIDYLERSATSDGTRPKGTIYFVKNNNIRSEARHGLFPAAVEALEQLGVRAEILQGTVPKNKPDVQGVVMGTASFNWKSSGSTILPGAICEHFTSYGGIMREKASQTPLSEFLRYGAAGASGTVTEPYSIPQKFPSPMIQVHYARGCSLAEAFYQSVSSPYQLLIVGDPLCRPWAEIPTVSVNGIEPRAKITGTLRITPSATTPDNKPVERFDLFIDGRLFDSCRPGGHLTLDSEKLADGWHQLRVVAVGPPPIESQGRLIMPVRLANHDRTITASVEGDGPFPYDRPITINAKSPGAKGIIVLHGSHVVGKLDAAEGRIEIAPEKLGAGPVRLRVIGLGGDVTTNVAAEPITLIVKPRPVVAPDNAPRPVVAQ